MVEKSAPLFKANTRKTKIFLLSSGDIKGTREELSNIGVDRVLVKPVLYVDLKRVIMQEFQNNPLSNPRENNQCEAAVPGPDSIPMLNILLAEDNPINRKLVERLLNTKGWSVKHAVNGKEAIQQYREQPFDLILMDIQMPEVDGFEAASRIRVLEKEQKQDKRIPIIALTAHAMSNYKERSFASGMDDYLTKPIDPQRLYALIEKHININE